MCLCFCCSCFLHAWARSTIAGCTSSPLLSSCVCVKLYVSCKLVLWCHTQHIRCKINRISAVSETYVLLETIVMSVSVYIMTILHTWSKYFCMCSRQHLCYPLRNDNIVLSLSVFSSPSFPVSCGKNFGALWRFSPNRKRLLRPAVISILLDELLWMLHGFLQVGEQQCMRTAPLSRSPLVWEYNISGDCSLCACVFVLYMIKSSLLTSWVIS